MHARYQVEEYGRGQIKDRKGASTNEQEGGCRSRSGRAGQTVGVNSHACNVSRHPEHNGISGRSPGEWNNQGRGRAEGRAKAEGQD